MAKNKQASAVAVFNRNQDILLLERSPQSRMQGWGLPGGHAHDNEPPDVAASRELLEETGIYVVCSELIYVGNHPSADGLVDVALYRIDIDNPEVQLSDEHIAYTWTRRRGKDYGLAGNTGIFMEAAIEHRDVARGRKMYVAEIKMPAKAVTRLMEDYVAQNPALPDSLGKIEMDLLDIQRLDATTVVIRVDMPYHGKEAKNAS